MKLTRKGFFALAFNLASLTLLSKNASATPINEHPMNKKTLYATSTNKEQLLFTDENSDAYTVTSNSKGFLHIVTVISPQNSINRIIYNSSTGNISSSYTGNSFFIGITPESKQEIKPNSVIDHVPPVIYEDGSTRRKVHKNISYKDLHNIVGVSANIVTIAAAIIAYALLNTNVITVGDMLARFLDVIQVNLENASPNHGIRIYYTEVDRYTIQPVTGGHIYYDTLRSLTSIGLY